MTPLAAERRGHCRIVREDFGLAGSCGSTRLRPPPMVPTQMSPSLPSSIAMTRSSLKRTAHAVDVAQRA